MVKREGCVGRGTWEAGPTRSRVVRQRSQARRASLSATSSWRPAAVHARHTARAPAPSDRSAAVAGSGGRAPPQEVHLLQHSWAAVAARPGQPWQRHKVQAGDRTGSQDHIPNSSDTAFHHHWWGCLLLLRSASLEAPLHDAPIMILVGNHLQTRQLNRLAQDFEIISVALNAKTDVHDASDAPGSLHVSENASSAGPAAPASCGEAGGVDQSSGGALAGGLLRKAQRCCGGSAWGRRGQHTVAGAPLAGGWCPGGGAPCGGAPRPCTAHAPAGGQQVAGQQQGRIVAADGRFAGRAAGGAVRGAKRGLRGGSKKRSNGSRCVGGQQLLLALLVMVLLMKVLEQLLVVAALLRRLRERHEVARPTGGAHAAGGTGVRRGGTGRLLAGHGGRGGHGCWNFATGSLSGLEALHPQQVLSGSPRLQHLPGIRR